MTTKRILGGVGVLTLISLLIFLLPYFFARDAYYEPFNGPGLPDGWDIVSDSLPGDWTWTSDGSASGGTYYGQRGSIASESGGGAAVFNADSLSGGDTTRYYSSRLVSPKIRSVFRNERVYLSFYTWYRKFDGSATVEVYGTDRPNRLASVFNNEWIRIDTLPTAAIQFDSMYANQETDTLTYLVYDITDLVAGKFNVRIRFTFSGSDYFWIIDDLRIGPDYLSPGAFPEPDDPYDLPLETVLRETGERVATDGQGGYFPSNELVVYWEPAATGLLPTPAQRDSIRESLDMNLLGRCPCDPRLEYWRYRYSDPGNTGRQTESDSIGIFGLKDGATAATESMTDFNYFNKTRGNVAPADPVTVTDPLALLERVPLPAPQAVLIAILDTGMDFDKYDVMRYLYRNADDESCMDGNDPIGWNFVADNPAQSNVPLDDHPGKHGSNVTRVILKEMLETDYNFRLLPVKTHDYRGLSNLYEVTCGTFYAIERGAQVINMSWGWYGAPNSVLKVALDSARSRNITVVTAVGNAGYELGVDTTVYPAMYSDLPNMLAVGAMVQTSDAEKPWVMSQRSNYSPEYVDLAAEGVDVYVLGTEMPAYSRALEEQLAQNGDVLGLAMHLNGTSFAAPFVTAMAARARAADPLVLPWEAVLQCAVSLPEAKRLPENKVANNARIAPRDTCGF